MPLPDIFLSYSRDDQATARRFAEAFEQAGLTVWWDQALNAGQAFDRVTEKELQDARAVVVLWSKRSVESNWVRAEATQAHASQKLVPVMIEPCKRPIMFELTHTADLSQWKGDVNDKVWRAYVADVRRLVGRDTDPATSPAATAPVGARTPRAPWVAVAGTLAAVIAVGSGWWLLHRGGSSAPSAGIAIGDVTLAVLPFADLSPAHDQENFSDGLTEEILNELAQVKHLIVTGRTSSFSFKGKNEDLRAIGAKLGVANLLEGSIRKDGKSLRITAQLINSSNGAHLWSQTYDRELNDIFMLQEEIAHDVAVALSVKLDVGDLRRAEGGTTNVEAYEKFLRAEAPGQTLDPDINRQQVQLFREAVALDSGFARAWVGLQRSLDIQLISPDPRTAAATRKEIQDIQDRVVALAPDTWWTQTMLAERFRTQHLWTEAMRADSAAIAAAPPNTYSVASTHALLLWATGQMHAAASYMRNVYPANPLSDQATLLLTLSLAMAGQTDEALAAYQHSRDAGLTGSSLDGTGAWLRTLPKAGADPSDADFREPLMGPITTGFDTLLAGHLGDKEFIRAAIRQELEDSVARNQRLPDTALSYADYIGDRQLVLDVLRRRLVDLNALTFHELWLPNKAGYRSDPKFKNLLRDLGLADYFSQSGNWGDFCKRISDTDFECH
jgi:TolB-like protein